MPTNVGVFYLVKYYYVEILILTTQLIYTYGIMLMQYKMQSGDNI